MISSSELFYDITLLLKGKVIPVLERKRKNSTSKRIGWGVTEGQGTVLKFLLSLCLQVACVGRVRNHLLKTSKILRQQHGSQKETKVREYETLYLLQLLRYCGVG